MKQLITLRKEPIQQHYSFPIPQGKWTIGKHCWLCSWSSFFITANPKWASKHIKCYVHTEENRFPAVWGRLLPVPQAQFPADALYLKESFCYIIVLDIFINTKFCLIQCCSEISKKNWIPHDVLQLIWKMLLNQGSYVALYLSRIWNESGNTTKHLIVHPVILRKVIMQILAQILLIFFKVLLMSLEDSRITAPFYALCMI